MKQINFITVERLEDNDTYLGYLGEFASEPGEFAIAHNGGINEHPWFNADNVEDMEQAQQNYDRIMQFERGEVQHVGIQAKAELQVNGVLTTIESSGLWGIESDSDDSYIIGIEQEQVDELKEMLLELGFSQKEVTQVVQKERATV